MTSKGMLRFSRWFVTADVVTTSVPSVRRAARTRPSGTLRTPIRPRTRGLPVPTVHRLLTSLRGRGAEEASLREVEVVARSLDSFAPPLVRPAHLARFETALRAAAGRLTGRTLWHVNSTSEGGGVAELLHGLLGYLCRRRDPHALARRRGDAGVLPGDEAAPQPAPRLAGRQRPHASRSAPPLCT
jgi:hypothetical protein